MNSRTLTTLMLMLAVAAIVVGECRSQRANNGASPAMPPGQMPPGGPAAGAGMSRPDPAVIRLLQLTDGIASMDAHANTRLSVTQARAMLVIIKPLQGQTRIGAEAAEKAELALKKILTAEQRTVIAEWTAAAGGDAGVADGAGAPGGRPPEEMPGPPPDGSGGPPPAGMNGPPPGGPSPGNMAGPPPGDSNAAPPGAGPGGKPGKPSERLAKLVTFLDGVISAGKGR